MNNSYPILSTRDSLVVGTAIESYREAQKTCGGFDDSSFRNLVKVRSCKDFFDEGALDSIVQEFRATRASIAKSSASFAFKRNEQEEEFAALAVRMTEEFPTEALQDPDFWRYLSIFVFRDYICAIEADFSPSRYGGLGNKNLIRWTLIRGLVWGLHCKFGDDLTGIYKARLVKEGLDLGSEVRDFYISHVVRPEWAKSPNAGPAFIDAAMSDPPLFDRGKEFRPSQYLGSRVSRISRNIYFPSLSKDEIESVVMTERIGIPDKPPSDLASQED